MSPYKHRAKLSDADKERALAMFFSGEPFDVIAFKINCSASNVYALTRRFRPVSKRKINRRSYRSST